MTSSIPVASFEPRVAVVLDFLRDVGDGGLRHAVIPVALIEAMMSGVPVVASGVSGIPELVREAGFLVPPGDPWTLADRFGELARSLGGTP